MRVWTNTSEVTQFAWSNGRKRLKVISRPPIYASLCLWPEVGEMGEMQKLPRSPQRDFSV